MLLVAGVTAYAISFWYFPVIAGIALGLIVAAACGVFNGVIISKFNVNPFITTLASMGIIRGLKEQVSGTGILVYNDFFKSISQTKLLNTQLPVYYLILLIIVFTYLLMRNRFFRGFYFVGGNEFSAKISGINVVKQKISAYIFTGVFAGIAGIVMASRIGGALITTGGGVELRVITATVLGGASLEGGEGSIIGSVLGILFMNLIHNVLIMGHISPYLIRVVFAVVLIFAVSMDVIIKKQRKVA
jgi:ribose transport system permease protein